MPTRNRPSAARALQRAVADALTTGTPHILIGGRVAGLGPYAARFGSAPADALRRLLRHRLAEARSGATAFRLRGDRFALLAPGDASDLEAARLRALAALAPNGRGFRLQSACRAVVLTPESTARKAIREVTRIPKDRSWSAPPLPCPADKLLSLAYDPDSPAQDLARALAMRLGASPGWLPLAAAGHAAAHVAMPDELLARRGTLHPAEEILVARQAAAGGRLLRTAGKLNAPAKILEASTRPWRNAPLESRILAVALAYASSPAPSTFDALLGLRAAAGHVYDPAVVDALIAELAGREATRFRAPAPAPPGAAPAALADAAFGVPAAA